MDMSPNLSDKNSVNSQMTTKKVDSILDPSRTPTLKGACPKKTKIQKNGRNYVPPSKNTLFFGPPLLPSLEKIKLTKNNTTAKNIKAKYKKNEISCLPPTHSPEKQKNKKKVFAGVKDKNGVGGKIIMWNKGNSTYAAKKDDIEIIVGEHKPLCLIILEANVDGDCHLPSLTINGYEIELDSLWANGMKARTLIYVKEGTPYKRRRDLEPALSPAVWLEFCPGSKKAWMLFGGYREWCCLHHTDKQESRSMKQQLQRLDKWEESWSMAEDEGKPLFLMGDFNVDVGPWFYPETTLTRYQKKQKLVLTRLKEMCFQLNLDILKSDPTRYQGNCTPSTLDVTISNRIDLISKPLLLNSSTDHKLVIITKTGKPLPEKPSIIICRNYKKYTKSGMLDALNIVEINKLMWSDNTDFVAGQLVHLINMALDQVAPVKKIQIRNRYAPYISESTKVLMKERDSAKYTFLKSQSGVDKKICCYS